MFKVMTSSRNKKRVFRPGDIVSQARIDDLFLVIDVTSTSTVLLMDPRTMTFFFCPQLYIFHVFDHEIIKT
jgi:hypothetical protein